MMLCFLRKEKNVSTLLSTVTREEIPREERWNKKSLEEERGGSPVDPSLFKLQDDLENGNALIPLNLFMFL